MPDESGALTPNDKKKIQKWMHGRISHPECPFCGSRKWTLGDYLVSPSAIGPTGQPQAAISYPLAMLISECGHVALFSVASLLRQGKPQDATIM
jgi:hypothetical protein